MRTPFSQSRLESNPDARSLDDDPEPVAFVAEHAGSGEREPKPEDPEAETLIPIRLLIVDDSLVFLGTLRRLMETLPGIELVGLATSARDALELVDLMHPDVVLTDLAMPEMDGLQMARLLAIRPDKPMIVIMSIHDLPGYRKAARSAGADAFITKSDLINQIQPLLRQLLSQSKPGGPQRF